MIHKTAIIEDNVKLGEGTNVWAFVQIRSNVNIGKNCMIGNGSYIDIGVCIGDNVRIINKVLIHRGVEIDDNVFLGPFVCFLNDKNPRHNLTRDLSNNIWYVRKGASIGACSIIMADVNIGEYALVGAGSLVTKDVPAHGLVYGSPARLHGFVCFCGQKLNLQSAVEKELFMDIQCAHCDKKVNIKKIDFNLCK